jgi:chemotaxis protein MotD
MTGTSAVAGSAAGPPAASVPSQPSAKQDRSGAADEGGAFPDVLSKLRSESGRPKNQQAPANAREDGAVKSRGRAVDRDQPHRHSDPKTEGEDSGLATSELLLAVQAANARWLGPQQGAADPATAPPDAPAAAGADNSGTCLSAALARLGMSSDPANAVGASLPGASPKADEAAMPMPHAAQDEKATPAQGPTSPPVRVHVLQQQTLYAPVADSQPLTQLAEQVAVALRPAGGRQADAISPEPVPGPRRGEDNPEPADGDTKDGEAPLKVETLPVPAPAARVSQRGQPATASHVFPAIGLGARAEDAPRGSTAADVGKATAAPVPGAQPPLPGADNPSPIQQIVTRIASELAAAQGGQTSPTDPAAATAKIVYGSPVKVLHIQLQPAELGTITVRMSLHDSELRIHLDADRRETAHRLQTDRDALSSVLRSAGYRVEGVSIQVAGADASAGGSQSFLNSSMQQQPGGPQPDAQRSGGNSGGRQDRSAYQTHGRNDEEGNRNPRGSGLYI